MADHSHDGSDRLAETDIQRQAWLALPRRLFRLFLGFDIAFVALYVFAVAVLHLQHSRLFLFFNLDTEANPPAWYSGIQLFLIALAFFMLASRLIPEHPKVTNLRRLWLLLAVGFTFLSADEVGEVHEQLSALGHRMNIDVRLFDHALFGDRWEWVYLLVGVALLFAFRKQLALAWREWRSESLQFIVGFVLVVIAAAILEALHLRFHRRFFFGWRDIAETALEEGIEMLGATILLLPAFRILSFAVTSRADTGRSDHTEEPADAEKAA